MLCIDSVFSLQLSTVNLDQSVGSCLKIGQHSIFVNIAKVNKKQYTYTGYLIY